MLQRIHEADGEVEAVHHALPKTAEEAIALVQYDSNTATAINDLIQAVIDRMHTEYSNDATTAQASVVTNCNGCIDAANLYTETGGTACSTYRSDMCSHLSTFTSTQSAWQGTSASDCSVNQQCFTYDSVDDFTSTSSANWPQGNPDGYTSHGFDETTFNGHVNGFRNYFKGITDNCVAGTGGFPPFLNAYNSVQSTCQSLQGCRSSRCTNYDTCWTTATGTDNPALQTALSNTLANLQSMERMLLYTKCMVTAAVNSADAASVASTCGDQTDSTYDSTLTAVTLQGCGDKVACVQVDIVCDSTPNTQPVIDGQNDHTWSSADANDNDVTSECAGTFTPQVIGQVPAGGLTAGSNAGSSGGSSGSGGSGGSGSSGTATGNVVSAAWPDHGISVAATGEWYGGTGRKDANGNGYKFHAENMLHGWVNGGYGNAYISRDCGHDANCPNRQFFVWDMGNTVNIKKIKVTPQAGTDNYKASSYEILLSNTAPAHSCGDAGGDTCYSTFDVSSPGFTQVVSANPGSNTNVEAEHDINQVARYIMFHATAWNTDSNGHQFDGLRGAGFRNIKIQDGTTDDWFDSSTLCSDGSCP